MPRPFELAAITAIVQRAMDKAILGDEDAFDKEFFKSIGHMITPIDAAGIIGGYSGVVAALFNRDFFRQKHIIPPEDIGVTIAGRNTEYASKFGKLVQEASDLLTKGEDKYLLDARKVDAFLQGQFSYYGNFFLKLTEAILPGESQEKFKFGPNSTGFFRYANAYAEPDVQWLMRVFTKYPRVKDKFTDQYNQFVFLLQNYFEDETQIDREKRREVGKALREFADEKRTEWKDVNFDTIEKEFSIEERRRREEKYKAK
jgi:hypothetical protein